MSEPVDQVEPFEVSEAEKSSSSGWMLGAAALCVGLIGVGCGIFGFLQAREAQAAVAELRAELALLPDPTAELRESLDGRYGELDGRLERFGAELVKINQLDRQVRSLREDSQRAFETVTRDVRTNRTAINELTGRFQQVVEAMETRSAPAAAAAPEPVRDAPVSREGTEQPAGDIHVIQSGETLSRVATQYGITLNQLLEANPGVNPNRLQIGQRITIPQQ